MTRLQLRYLTQENVITLLMNKMRAAAEGSEMPWEDFFESFISHMWGIIMQMTLVDGEKMMIAIQKSPRAGFEFIASHFLLNTKEPLHRFIVVALANISYRSRLPEEILYLASRLVMKVMTDYCRLTYAHYVQACFNDFEKAYGGKAEDEILEENIVSEYGGQNRGGQNISGIFTT